VRDLREGEEREVLAALDALHVANGSPQNTGKVLLRQAFCAPDFGDFPGHAMHEILRIWAYRHTQNVPLSRVSAPRSLMIARARHDHL